MEKGLDWCGEESLNSSKSMDNITSSSTSSTLPTSAELAKSLIEDPDLFDSIYDCEEDNDLDPEKNALEFWDRFIENANEFIQDNEKDINTIEGDIPTDEPLMISENTLHIADVLLSNENKETDREPFISLSNKELSDIIKERDEIYRNQRKTEKLSQIKVEEAKKNIESIPNIKNEMINADSISLQDTKSNENLSLFQQNKLRTFNERSQKNKQLIEYLHSLAPEVLERSKQKMDRLIESIEEIYEIGKIGKQWIAVIDMDAFFASVEELDYPEYKSVPMAVGGNSMLCTANYEARKFGIKAGMPGFKAKKLCSNLTILPVNFKRYEEVSSQTIAIMREYDSNLVRASIDEAYLDLTNLVEKKTTELIENDSKYVNISQTELEELGEIIVQDIVDEIRKRIKNEVHITASAGISNSHMISKTCSNCKKPDGQTLIKRNRESVKNFFFELPVRKIHGIGEAMEHLLNDLNIHTMKDLFNNMYKLYHITTPKHFSYLFYKALAMDAPNGDEPPEKLISQIGINNKSYKNIRDIWLKSMITNSNPKSLGIERTFEPTENVLDLFNILVRIACIVKDSLIKDLDILNSTEIQCKESRSKSQVLKGPTCVLRIKFTDYTSITRTIGISDFFTSLCNKKIPRNIVKEDIINKEETEKPLFYFLNKNLLEPIDRIWNPQQVALRCWEVLFPILRANYNGELENLAFNILENPNLGSQIKILRNVRKLGIAVTLIPRTNTDGIMSSWLSSKSSKNKSNIKIEPIKDEFNEPNTSDTEEPNVNTEYVHGSLENHLISNVSNRNSTSTNESSDTQISGEITFINNFNDADINENNSSINNLKRKNNNNNNNNNDIIERIIKKNKSKPQEINSLILDNQEEMINDGIKLIYEDKIENLVLISRKRLIECPICNNVQELWNDFTVDSNKFYNERSNLMIELDSSDQWSRLLTPHIDKCIGN